MRIKDYETILDSLQITGIYVIREDNHEMLYFNRYIKEVAPRARIGMACSELGNGSCSNCPLRYIGDRDRYKSVKYDGPFGKAVDVEASRILWEDEVPAFMITVTPHIEQKDYAHSMVLKGCLDTGVYEILKMEQKEYQSFTYEGSRLWDCLGQDLQMKAVHPDDVERLTNYINPEYLKGELSSGKEIASCTYRRRQGREFRWHIMETVPDFDYAADRQNVRVYVKDVDDIYRDGFEREETNIRNQEIINMLGEMNFGIFMIVLDTGVAEAVRAAGELEAYFSSARGDWECFVRELREQSIHPSYQDEFTQKYGLDALRFRWRGGEKKVEEICQQMVGGEYHYVSVTAYFCESSSQGGYVILTMQDVDERERTDIARAHSDKRMAGIIQSRYNMMNIVHLDTGVCERFRLGQFGESRKVFLGQYEHHIRKACNEAILEEDRGIFWNTLSLENLRRESAATEDSREIVIQYRLKAEKVMWIEEHIFFVKDDKSGVVNILGRDITKEKQREEEEERARREKAYIIDTLSGMFFATYYMDMEKDLFRMVRQKAEVAEVLGDELSCSEAIWTYAVNFVHPEDREEYLDKLDYVHLRETLSRDHPIVAAEYRKVVKDNDGSFREDGWIRASVVLAEMEGDKPKIALYVAQDITESREREEREHRALMAACEAANHASASKSEFLSRMSHDIRTPMNAIIGMTAIAGAHLDDSERVSDCLNKITVSSRHLLSLINEVLDMSKIESGKMNLAEEAFNLSDMISNVMTIIRPSVQQKQHELQLHIAKVEHEDVIGDVMRLQQIFMNLLGNAVKYTPPGGRIELDVCERPSKNHEYGCYEFRFRDNGIGMGEEFVKKIFEPFSREEDSRISKIEGTGLGMTIVQNIVRMMNGNIRVESEVGKGSTFTVTVFLKQQDAVRPEGGREETINEEAARQRFLGKRVLLAEDNEINREIAEEMIGETGVALESVTNGMEAVDQFSKMDVGYYDLIFMDIQMPVMNGYEASRAIRSLDRADAVTIPIVAMTANAFAEDVMASREAGMNEHISKPLSIERLIACMRRWLA